MPKQVLKHLCRTDILSIYKTAKFLVPFSFLACYFLLISVFFEKGQGSKFFGLILAYLFPPLGKESIIPSMIGIGISPFFVWTSIVIFDVCCVFILRYSWWFPELLIKKNKWLTKGYNKLQEKANKTKSKRWIIPALFGFMIIPFQGSGAISVSIVGMIIGLKKTTLFLIVTIGSIISTTLIMLVCLGFIRVLLK